MRFKDIFERLEAIYQVSDKGRAAFQARIHHLQKKGWPPETKTGRGVAADWSEKNYRELAIALELCACGIPPEKAIEITKANYTALLEAAETGSVCEVRTPPMFGDAMPRSTILVNLSALT